MKKYSFEITTVKNYQDENSPHFLARFEFIAENKENAERYRDSLVKHYNDNAPYRHSMPRQITLMQEIEVQ